MRCSAATSRTSVRAPPTVSARCWCMHSRPVPNPHKGTSWPALTEHSTQWNEDVNGQPLLLHRRSQHAPLGLPWYAAAALLLARNECSTTPATYMVGLAVRFAPGLGTCRFSWPPLPVPVGQGVGLRSDASLWGATSRGDASMVRGALRSSPQRVIAAGAPELSPTWKWNEGGGKGAD
eukprot:411878-Rhodomonas_salina.1